MKNKNIFVLEVVLLFLYLMFFAVLSYVLLGKLGFVLSLNIVLVSSILGVIKYKGTKKDNET